MELHRLLISLLYICWCSFDRISCTENVTYVVINVQTTGRQGDCPSQLDVTLPLGTRSHTLRLLLNQRIRPHNVPVTLSGDVLSVWSTEQGSGHICAYQDLSSLASFTTRHKNGSLPLLEGSFHFEGNRYCVEPHQKYFSNDNLYKVLHLGEYIDPPTKRTRLKRSSPTQHYVELLLVIDYKEYSKWLNFDIVDGFDDAVDNIRYYFSHVINEVDLRYQSIDSDDIAISVILKEIFITTGTSQSSWTEDSSNRNGDEVDAGEALDDFVSWLGQQTQYTSIDHAMLVTGYDLFDYDSSTNDVNGITGQAYIGDICNSRRVSIVEDNGLFNAASVAAHELGHSLGARHDGESGSACQPEDQFIMTATIENRDTTNFLNVYTFSSCSVAEFKEEIQDLNNDNNNCLLNIGSVFDSNEWSTYMQQEPGRKYTLDEQCYFIFGEGSIFCGSQSEAESMCRSLVCLDPARDSCFVLSSPGALDYTTCGNKKWCYRGDCVYDSSAPAVDDSCIFGDYPLPLWDDSMTCSEMIETYPWYCYIQTNSVLCCESCASVYTGIDECEYGDQASWCSGLESSQCYYNGETCCKTCHDHNTGSQDCPYGDRATWCSASIVPSECYHDTNEYNCCGTCAQYRNYVEGCEFGDRAEGCFEAHCVQETNHDTCCETCGNPSDFITTTTQRPTVSDSGNTVNTCLIHTLFIYACFTSIMLLCV